MTAAEISKALAKRGFRMDDGGLRVIGEKDGHRVTILYTKEGHLQSVFEEICDTSTIIRLTARKDRGVTLSAEVNDDGTVSFIRNDKVSATVLTL